MIALKTITLTLCTYSIFNKLNFKSSSSPFMKCFLFVYENDSLYLMFVGLTKKGKGYWFTDYIWENGEPLLYNSWYSF
jgi:hypothetical protein